jgi:glycosyltransferase involved in cell wall biosynthesis
MRTLVVPGNRLILWRLRRTGALIGQIVHELGLRDTTGWQRVLAGFEQSDFDSIDAIFFHNEELRDRSVATRAVDPGRIHMIPHGDGSIFARLDEGRDVEVTERYGLSADDRLILMFGGIRPSKGSDDLVRAFALLPTDRHVKLLIAGPLGRGLDPHTLPALADDLGVGDRAIFDYRYVEMGEVAALMRRADVVAFPYRTATQSGVLATSMTFGRPVVVTAVGGLPDVVEDGRNGLVVPPSDPSRLAAALCRILDGPDLAAAMSEASLEMNSRFSWSEVGERVLGAYVELDEHR